MDENQLRKIAMIQAFYGKDIEIEKAIEEMIELLYELTVEEKEKFKIESEMADVLVMMEHIKIMYDLNDDTICNLINLKLNRQLGRIKEEMLKSKMERIVKDYEKTIKF